jgi:hypothetical protein
VRFDRDRSDPPGPLSVVHGFLGAALALATLALVVGYLRLGHLDGRLAALVGVLWLLSGIFGDLLGFLVEPFLGLLGGQLTGGQDPGPPVRIDMARETELLEQLVAHPPPVPHREIIAAIRLAEIYRTSQGNRAKADALLARLRAKYPEAPELQHDSGAA